MAKLQIGVVSLGLFKDFITSNECSDEHKRLLSKVESEYNDHCALHKITHEKSNYFDGLFGFIDSSDSSEKSKKNFLSVFLAFINWSNAPVSPDVRDNKTIHVLNHSDFAPVSLKPKQFDGKVTDEEYERGFLQFISMAGKKTRKVFKKAKKKYDKFLSSIDSDVENMLKNEFVVLGRINPEKKMVFVDDNNFPVHLGEQYVEITNGVAQIKKCFADDYVGQLGSNRFSISNFISPN